MIFEQSRMNKKIDLIWNNLTATVQDEAKARTTLIDDVSGVAKSGTLTCIIGILGSGKTTLLNILSGQIPKELDVTGEVILKSEIPNEKMSNNIISFVCNSYHFLPFQTVYETLFFSVKMYNIDKDNKQIHEIVKSILHMLDLIYVMDEKIQFISDGEKEMVKIGISISESPNILILDEPCDYLDFYHIKKLTKIMRSLLSHNMTIVASLKHPNTELIEMADNLVLMSLGVKIFEGSLEEYKTIFNNDQNKPIEDSIYDSMYIDYSNEYSFVNSIQNIRRIKDTYEKNQKNDSFIHEAFPIEIRKSRKIHQAVSFIILRYLTSFIRNKRLLRSLLIQKAIFFLIVCLVYPQIKYTQPDIRSRMGLISFLILNSTERAASITLGSFAGYRKIITRELCMEMYSGYDAYLSQYIFFFLVITLSTFSYIIPVYWISNINPSFGRFILFLLNHLTLTSFTVAYSLLVGIYTSSHGTAHILGAIILTLCVAFSGMFVNLSTIPSFSRWISWISPLYYAFESNLQVAFNDQTYTCGSETRCFKTGTSALKFYGITRVSYLFALGIQWVIIVAVMAIGCISMIIKNKSRLLNK